MFIFWQFNFPDPKPRVSEGDWKVPGEVGVGASAVQKQKESRRGFSEGGEGGQGTERTLSGKLESVPAPTPRDRASPSLSHLASASRSEEEACIFVIHDL